MPQHSRSKNAEAFYRRVEQVREDYGFSSMEDAIAAMEDGVGRGNRKKKLESEEQQNINRLMDKLFPRRVSAVARRRMLKNPAARVSVSMHVTEETRALLKEVAPAVGNRGAGGVARLLVLAGIRALIAANLVEAEVAQRWAEGGYR